MKKSLKLAGHTNNPAKQKQKWERSAILVNGQNALEPCMRMVGGGVAQKQVFGSCAKTASIVSINFTYAHLDMRK